MANHLELRSTFRLSGEGLGTISAPSENRIFENPYKRKNIEEQSANEDAHQKNNFAVATTISRAIFNGLGEDLRNCVESYSSKKLSSKINKCFSGSTSRLSLKDYDDQISGFDFNSEEAFDAGVRTKFCIKKAANNGHVIFHIPAFVPQSELKVPKGATNFKICARLIALSDFEKNGNDYHTTNIRQHGKLASFQTPMLPLLRITTQPMTSQLRISNPGFNGIGMSSVLVLGIKFYTYKEKKFNRLEESTRIKIMKVY